MTGESKHRNQKTREVECGRRKELQEEGVTREIYGKDIVWVG